MSPYHLRDIPKGVLGEPSKINEELLEFLDAVEQQNPVLELCELADMIGAIEAYTMKKYGITVDQLQMMAELNKKAFQSGYRT